MYVIGTAGHVDHGKSTLVQAMTGIDPDRLREEKERGMTIDLGFAWLKLPSGREISIVDVPGHERFIKNMLAGVGGIDLALLVIAADEGIMPQTSEHLAILDLLAVQSGVVVVTKKDLVDNDWLELVIADVEDAIAPTSFAGSPILAVSATTRDGLDTLLSTIDERLASMPPKRDIGKPRLPIDRVFTISGFGTVVTGTLIDGTLSAGQEIEVQPGALRSRIRGIQTHKRKVDVAGPGNRVAANLASLATDELRRGQVVTFPGWLKPTDVVDVKLRLVPSLDKPMGHNAVVTFHSGASEAVGTVRLLERPEVLPGETSWAQIKLSEPVALVKGDFFIVRSSMETLGGGVIVDPHPKRHRRFHAPTLDALSTMEKGTPEEIVLQTLERIEPAELKAVIDKCGLPQTEAKTALTNLLSEAQAIALGHTEIETSRLPAQTNLFSRSGWGRMTEKIQTTLEQYHQSFPLRIGMPKEELKSRLRLTPRLFSEVMERLAQEGQVGEESNAFRLPTYVRRLSPAQQSEVDRYLQSLRNAPFAPPGDIHLDADLLNYLSEEKKVVKVADGVVFDAAAYDEMLRRIIEKTREKGTITVAEVRDIFGTSRKYALAIMEHLDEQRITRRVGDERVLRG